jgi:hypothetical protein
VLGYDGSLAGISSLGEDQGNVQSNNAGTLQKDVSKLKGDFI